MNTPTFIPEDGESNAYVDFKGYRFSSPFRCLNCGREIGLRQFCFSRLCGGCDCSEARNRHGCFSGPREVSTINPDAPICLRESIWLNPECGLSDDPDEWTVAIQREIEFQKRPKPLKLPSWS